jgi:CheY-like chemotaxis protein
LSYALIVGNDTPDRAWVETTLLGGGLEVSAAPEADVLATRELMPPRLLVLDDAAGGEGRMATIRRLQAHPELKGVPMVVLAYDADIDSFTNAITKGVSAYLVKPVNPAELVDVARRLSGWTGVAEHTERRRRLRRPLIMKLEVEIRAQKRKLAGQMVDVSGGGCRVEIGEALAPGEALRIILHSQDASTHVALSVEARWCRGTTPGVWQVGCRFTGTTALLAGKILGFVSTGLT